MEIIAIDPIDWDAIEREYRTGVLSVRQISRDYNLSESAIRKRAARDGWDRDLSPRVAVAVSAALVRARAPKVRRDGARAPEVLKNESEIIADAVHERVAVRLFQRGAGKKAHDIAVTLLARLERSVAAAGLKCTDLPMAEARCLKEITGALTQIHAIQENAWGLPKVESTQPVVSSTQQDDEKAALRAALFASLTAFHRPAAPPAPQMRIVGHDR